MRKLSFVTELKADDKAAIEVYSRENDKIIWSGAANISINGTSIYLTNALLDDEEYKNMLRYIEEYLT